MLVREPPPPRFPVIEVGDATEVSGPTCIADAHQVQPCLEQVRCFLEVIPWRFHAGRPSIARELRGRDGLAAGAD